MRLILLRHGETDWNALDRYQGHTDIALNAVGERQARAAAAGPVGDLLQQSSELVAVASPLLRARETARIVLEATVGAVDLTTDPGLMELGGGEWEGLELSMIAERWPREHEAWRTTPSLDASPVGGEVLRAGGMRLLAAASTHVPEAWSGPEPVEAPGAEEASPRTLLVVAHGAVIRGAVGLLLGLEGEDFAGLARLDNAKAVVLEGAFPDDVGGADGVGQWAMAAYGL